jgi:hypothetical protein
MNPSPNPHPRRCGRHHRISDPAQRPPPSHAPHPGSHHRQPIPVTTPTTPLTDAQCQSLPLTIPPSITTLWHVDRTVVVSKACRVSPPSYCPVT